MTRPPPEVSEILRAAFGDAVAPSRAAISTACHTLAQTLGWRLIKIDWRTDEVYAGSFHSVTFDAKDREVCLMIHAWSDVVALKTFRGSRSAYLGDTRLMQTIEDLTLPFTGFPAAGFEAELSEADRAFLSKVRPQMAYDLHYWNPKTVGDVLFNIWD